MDVGKAVDLTEKLLSPCPLGRRKGIHDSVFFILLFNYFTLFKIIENSSRNIWIY